jgi:hypothetical protein
MGSSERTPKATLMGRLVRGRRFDRNPLRRAADRAETIAGVLLLVAFLAGAPLALWHRVRGRTRWRSGPSSRRQRSGARSRPSSRLSGMPALTGRASR